MTFKPSVVSSLHGFKSHGKWQTKFADYMSSQTLSVSSFDYGYQFFSCLRPRFKKKLVEDFYNEYGRLTRDRFYQINTNSPIQRPSIVAHSLGSYILCVAMLKYPDIKFDKILLCGSIVDEHFDWDLLFRRNQVFNVRNEYSAQDKVVDWRWLLGINNSGPSGKFGFKCTHSSFEQQNFKLFEHGSFFDGNHMHEFWLPFFLKPPPIFHVLRGSEIGSAAIFTKLFDETGKIDNACFGNEPFWNDYLIPDNLADDWINVNPDIYSFLIKDQDSQEAIGYLNAMPLKDATFEQLLAGKVHDQNIKAIDIIPFEETQKNISLYIMSIAINPSFQAMHLGLVDIGVRKLFDSLFVKLEQYYTDKGIKVKKIAAVGWTDKGIKLCELIGLKETGVVEDQTNKPIYALDLENATDVKRSHKSIRRLIEVYRSDPAHV